MRMAFSMSEYIGDSILEDIKDEIISRHDIRYRKENFGYTVFDVQTLKTVLIDDKGFKILNAINGKDTVKDIIKRVSEASKMPYFIFCTIALRHLDYLFENKFINLTKKVSYDFKKEYSHYPVLNGPNQISWLITNQCNLQCSHCGNTSRAKSENELGKEECLRFIDECAKLNVFVLNISGGEPFMRKDWFEILSYARKKYIEIGITTNGTLITEDIVKKIKELEPFNVHISLDGIGKVHDEFRNKKGVYDSVLKTIALFKKHKIPFGLTTSITKKNFSDLDNVKDFIKENRINSWNLYYALPVGCLKQADAVSQGEFYQFAKKIVQFKEELKDITNISVGDSMGYFGSLKVRDSIWTGCGAGVCGCAMDAEGNIKGCPIQHDRFNEGNIRNKSLRDIWLDKNAFKYNRKIQKLSKHCRTCRHSRICKGGCKSSMFAQDTGFHYNDYCIYHIEQNVKSLS
jgi:radical SAM protein with 4Fe4S-binding SPASM domain